MKPRTTIVFALLMFGIGLVARAPASTLGPELDDRTNSRLQLSEAEGTIWSGRTSLSCRLPEGISVSCGHWVWRWVPENLLQAKLSLLLRRDNEDDSLLASWSANGILLERVSINLPAPLLGSIDSKIAALRLQGNLHIVSQLLSRNSGEVQIAWQKMESGLLPNQTLGDHNLALKLAPNGSVLTISSSPGLLTLSGGGTISTSGQATIDVLASVNGKNSVLVPMMALLGHEVAPGQFRLKLP